MWALNMSTPQPTGRKTDNISHLSPANTSTNSVRTTIPASVVKALGLSTDSTIRWEINGGTVTVKKQTDA